MKDDEPVDVYLYEFNGDTYDKEDKELLLKFAIRHGYESLTKSRGPNEDVDEDDDSYLGINCWPPELLFTYRYVYYIFS